MDAAGVFDGISGDVAYEVISAGAYRTPAWYEARRERVSASEIAAVVGLSPWQSRFDLWWSKRLPPDDSSTPRQKRGRRFEALVIEDFADAHPEFKITSCGLVANADRPWQCATPDALAFDGGTLVAPVEAKTSGSRHGWGEPGTDAIPIQYRCQVLWQMDTLGVPVAYVPVLFGFDYAEYVVEWHEEDVLILRDAARDFLRSLIEDEPPPIDSHTATTDRLKQLHPAVTEGEVEVPATIVRQYHLAKRLRDTAQDRMRLAENRLRDLLGDHQTATVDGRKVAGRSVYDVPERTQTVRGFTVNKLTWRNP